MSGKKTTLETLMEQNGWDESNFDGPSLDALKKLMKKQERLEDEPLLKQEPPSTTERVTSSAKPHGVPGSIERQTSSEPMNDFDIPESATEAEKLILKMLCKQSKLLRNLQDQLDDLKGSGISTSSQQRQENQNHVERPTEAYNVPRREPPVVEQPVLRRPLVPPREAAAAPPLPRQQPQPPPVVHRPHAAPLQNETLTRLNTLWRTFQILQRYKVKRFDWGLFLKMSLVSMILLSKMGKSHDHVMLGTFFAIFIGCCIQAGWLGLLFYVAFTKNYVWRILFEGEEPNAEAEYLNPLNQEQPAAEVEQQPQRNLFQNLIDPQAPQNNVQRFVSDLLLFVGSFVLSIFPMWEMPQPPPPPTDQPENEEQENEEQHNDGPDALPEVLPPQDPAGPAEDDEQ